jgi:hypothetical protein
MGPETVQPGNTVEWDRLCVALIKHQLRQYIRDHGLVEFSADPVVPAEFLPVHLHLHRNEEAHEGMLQTMRQGVRDNTRVATCLEFGPRFLH